MSKLTNQFIGKLINEGVKKNELTKEKAFEVANKCCGVAVLKHLIETNFENLKEEFNKQAG